MPESVPLVSVVVPVFNKVHFVAECLASIERQSHGNIEVLCVDDKSTDGSSLVIDSFVAKDSRFRVLRSNVQLGEGGARNLGIEAARGDAVFFVDADDWIADDAIGWLVALQAETRAPLVRGSVMVHRPWGQESPYGYATVPDVVKSPFSEDGSSAIPIWAIWSYLYSADLFRRAGIRFSPLAYGTDVVFLTECLLAVDRVAMSSRVIYHYRQDPPTVWNERRHLLSEVEAHARIRDNLVSAGYLNSWRFQQGSNMIPYFISMFGRGVPLITRVQTARELRRLLLPAATRPSRTGALRIRLLLGMLFGGVYVRFESRLPSIPAILARFRRRSARFMFRTYRAAPPAVHRYWRWLRRTFVGDVGRTRN